MFLCQGKDSSPPSSNDQYSFFNSSFGFDTQALSAVDKMEQEHTRKPLPIPGLSPITPNLSQRSSLPFTTTCGKTKDVHSTPNRTTPKSMVGHSELLVENICVVSSTVPHTTSSVVSHHNVKIKTASTSGTHHVSIPKLADKETVDQNITFNSKPCNGENAFKETSIREVCEGGTSNDPEKLDTKTPNMETSKLSGGETSTNNKSSTQNSSQGCLTQEQCDLSSWGLPENILEQYKKIGITRMFEWQAQCLRTGNVLNGGNIY